MIPTASNLSTAWDYDEVMGPRDWHGTPGYMEDEYSETNV
jgi:hypothetical protein